MEQKIRREQFIKELKLGVEQEYNVPNKPINAKDVDIKEVSQKIQSLIDNFCKQNQVCFEEIKESILKNLKECSEINPKSMDEYNLIKNILNYISSQRDKDAR